MPGQCYAALQLGIIRDLVGIAKVVAPLPRHQPNALWREGIISMERRFSQVPGAADFRQFSAGLTLISLLLGAAGCTTDGQDAHPAVQIKTITVNHPVAVACVKASDIPAEPEKIAGKLTGDARRDLDTVSASALRLRSWGKQLTALLSGCVMP